MCVIVVCEKGLRLTKDKFDSCFSSNSHGAGFAWMVNKKLGWKKGFMKAEDAWEFYQTINKFPHVAHFRLSSAGGVMDTLTHPFLITADSPIEMEGMSKKSLLFHNGTISGWREMVMMLSLVNRKVPDGDMSDTRAMAMAVSILGDKILDGGKYVIASPTEFTTYGSWDEKEGIYYSNLYWERTAFTQDDLGWYTIGSHRMYASDGKKETKKSSKKSKNNLNTDLPVQLRGVNRIEDKIKDDPYIMFKQSAECADMSEEEIFTSKILSGYYGRNQS
jgi:hypothetical protein